MTDSAPAQVLLVDDDPQVLRYLRISLEDAGYSVAATTSGKRARSLLKESPPSLLILDLNMPAPDGFELLKSTRAEFPYLRVLAISGYMQGALLQAALFLGAVATLEKPVSAETLVDKVRELLGH